MKDSYEIIWNLFKKTGDIKYFLLAKSIKESEDNEDSGCERTSINRDEL